MRALLTVCVMESSDERSDYREKKHGRGGEPAEMLEMFLIALRRSESLRVQGDAFLTCPTDH